MRTAYFRFASICALILVLESLDEYSYAAQAAEGIPTVEFAFESSAPDGIQITSTGETAFLSSVHRTGGAITASPDAAWQIAPDAAFGEGGLDFTLDRGRLAGDLALVLRADWDDATDLAIQLFDAENHVLAPDLFGNLAQNAPAAATDTFVVPLARYPLATRLTVRRLSGPLTIHAAALFPVLSELPSSVQAQQALADKLGLIFRPAVPSAAARSLPSPASGEKASNATLGTVHTVPLLEHTNKIAASTLAESGYPVFRRVTAGALPSEKFAASGTTFDFTMAAMRTLELGSQSALERPLFTSSNGVAACLLAGQANFGLMSMPLSSAEKERFFAKHGFPIMEFEVAHDAIEILVNAGNPLREITLSQLDAIYAQSPRAGARGPLLTWSELGAGEGRIHAFGGAPGWGTAKSFQQIVLKGGAFRSDIAVDDVVFRRGVEAEVARDTTAIGYVSLRPRQPDVRVLAVAANTGEKAWPVDADAIYSGHYPLQRAFYGYLAKKSLDEATPLEHEMVNLLLSEAGQTLVARGGSLPLSARETQAIRNDLKLTR